MKRSKLLLIIMALFLLVSVAGCKDKHEHVYGDWEIVVSPTEDKTGEAIRECECGDKDKEVVPALSDTNTWKVEVTDSTCTVKGNKKYTSKYGEIVIELPLANHEYGEWTLVKAPTETEKGSAERTCKYGEKETVDVPVLTDTKVWTLTVVDATCLKEGLKTYTSVYGKVEVKIEKLEHKFGEYVLTKNPTETLKGEAVKECSLCHTKESIEVPVLTDTKVWTLTVVDATCSKEGLKTYTSVYGKVEVKIEKLEHKFGEYVLIKNPTETLKGEAVRECSVCHTKDTMEVPVLTDTKFWTMTEVPATCTKEGLRTYKSSLGTIEVKVPILDHSFSDYVFFKNPTLTSKGLAIRECNVCHTKETVEVPALTDTEVWKVLSSVEADYNKKGNKVYQSIYGSITVELPKLVAPYDNKTYYSFGYDAEDSKTGGFTNGELSVETAWNKASITFDENGTGEGSSHPFRGYNVIKMVDSETGKIQIDCYDNRFSTTFTTTYGYVDFNTGIIVAPNNDTIRFAQVWTPFEGNVTSKQTNGSSWDNSLAIEYTYKDKTYNIYVTEERTYFNVEFVDIDGNKIQAKNCHNSPILYIKHNNTIINKFVYNGDKLVKSDGYEGKYTGEQGELILNGCGTATLKGVKGEYTLTKQGTKYTADLIVNNEYYELIITDKTYTLNKVMVNITLNGGEFASTNTVNINKNIKYSLPVLKHDSQTFKGWFYDEYCLEPVVGDFIPTKDITLYAYWVPKVIINIFGGIEGDPKKLYLGDGDTIGEYLPKYDLDLKTRKQFVGWYIDADFVEALPEDAIVTEADSGFTIYAKWEEIPSYYGTYQGIEVYGEDSSSYNNINIKIDINGNITGDKRYSGKIVNYDKNTQTITYKEYDIATEIKKMYFDEKSGVLAVSVGNKNDLSSDYVVFVRDVKEFNLISKFAIDIKEESSNKTGFYARFINLDTILGNKDILVMYNQIYSNITITNAYGEPLTATTIKDSKTVVAKDNESGNVILAYGSTDINFDTLNKKNVQLDQYYGVYTNGQDTVKLDGVNTIVYGEKVGTYEKQVAGNNVFDVYLNNNTEYYELTLTEKTFKLEKLMVTVSFDMGTGHNPIDALTVNKNVVMTFPNVTEEGYVFNGWFFDQKFTKPVENFIPTKDIKIYGKFSLPAVLTICYNNGEPDKTIVYSVGDIVEIEKPVLEGKVFVGWYTSSRFEPDTKFALGQEILTDTKIYGRWATAPLFTKSYGALEFNSRDNQGPCNISYKSTLAFNEYGKLSAFGWYPFNEPQEGQIINFNRRERIGIFKTINGSHNAYFSKEGIAVINQNIDNNDMNEIWLLAPKETEDYHSRVQSSYWLNGMARLIVYTDLNNVNHQIFIYNNKVYFDAIFSDLQGNEITNIKEVYKNSNGLRLFTSDKSLIAEFGLKGESLIPLDGKQGTYTVDNSSNVVLNGIDKIIYNGKEGIYTLVENESYTLTAVIDNAYYEVTLNGSNCVVNKPMVEITLNPNGGSINNETANQVNTFNKNIAITLPTPTYNGFIFKGWLDGNKLLDSKFIPTITQTLIAKWNKAYEVTLVFGNGIADGSIFVEENTPAVITNPTFENKIFLGWFTDNTFETPYTNQNITKSTTLYAKWIDKPEYLGSYTGGEFYRSFATKDKFLVIKDDLTFDNDRESKVGTILPDTYDANTGLINFIGKNDTYVMFYKTFGDVEYVVLNYSASKEDFLSSDVFVYVRGNVTKSFVKTWNNDNERIGFLITDQETNIFYMNALTNEFIGNITLENNQGTVLTPETIKTTESLIVKDFTGKVVKEYGVKDNEFVPLDGFEGTYKNESNTIILNGAGKITIIENLKTIVCEYELLENNVIKVIYSSGSMKTILINKVDKTYSFVDDNTKGTYKNGTDTFVSNGDGTCTFNGKEGIYVFDGNIVTIFVENITKIIDINSNGTYKVRSFLSGFKFKGSFVADANYGKYDAEVTVTFYDTTELTGEIFLNVPDNYDSKRVEFKGVEEGEKLTLTTSIGQFLLTHKGKKLAFTSGSILIAGTNYVLDGVNTVSREYAIPSAPVEKSIIAGYVFNGKIIYRNWETTTDEEWDVKVTFNNSNELKGMIEFSYSKSMEQPSVYEFDYTIENNVVVMTITSDIDFGKIIKANYENDSLTVIYSEIVLFELENMNAKCTEFLSETTNLLAGNKFIGTCKVQDNNGSIYDVVSRDATIIFSSKTPLTGTFVCEDYMGSTSYEFSATLNGNHLVIKTSSLTIEALYENNTINLISNYILEGHHLDKVFTLSNQ